MPYNEDTIEQIRFLAENWHRFSVWTRLQILVTVWWYVKVRAPLRRFAKRTGIQTNSTHVLGWLLAALLICVAFITFSPTAIGFQAHLSLIFALLAAGLLIGLSRVLHGK